MKYSILFLLAGTSAALIGPISATAMPLHLNGASGSAQILLVDDDGDEDNSWFGSDDDDDGNRKAGKGGADCGEGDDDDDGGCAGGQGAAPQNANPPANGLITPGSKPQVQIN